MLRHSVYLHTGGPFLWREALAKTNAIIQIEILCFRKRTLWQQRKFLLKFLILIALFTWNLSVRVRQRPNPSFGKVYFLQTQEHVLF